MDKVKIVVEASKFFSPKDGDIIVYNGEKGVWECKEHAYIFQKEQETIVKALEKVASLEDGITQFKAETTSKINKLASAIKTTL
jgi:Zn-finger protein